VSRTFCNDDEERREMNAVLAEPTRSEQRVSDGSRVLVTAHDLTRRYGEGDTAVDALRGVSVAVEEGELVAVMGASGSGSLP
jgi:putative ABC transport system ATP-binding protein